MNKERQVRQIYCGVLAQTVIGSENILKSKLNRRIKFELTKSLGITLLKYGACVTACAVDELKNLDRKTRNVLNIYMGYSTQKVSYTDCLYEEKMRVGEKIF